MEYGEIAGAGVFDDQAFVAAVVGFAHRGLYADFGRDAGKEQVRDAARLQLRVQVGGVERALAGFVDHQLPIVWRQQRQDLVARFAAHQNAAHRTFIANTQRGIASLEFGRRTVGQIRQMRFARVHHQHAVFARQRQQFRYRRDDGRQRPHIIAEHAAEAAFLDEIALHVDHHQRRAAAVELIGIGNGVDGNHAVSSCALCPDVDDVSWCSPWPAIQRPSSARSALAASVACTMAPSVITRMRSDNSSNSSRSSLTSRIAVPSARACNSRAWMSATEAKSRPNTGLATISTFTASSCLVESPSSRASTARCTLPPESVPMARSGSGGLTLKAAIKACACLRMAVRLTLQRSQPLRR